MENDASDMCVRERERYEPRIEICTEISKLIRSSFFFFLVLFMEFSILSSFLSVTSLGWVG